MKKVFNRVNIFGNILEVAAGHRGVPTESDLRYANEDYVGQFSGRYELIPAALVDAILHFTDIHLRLKLEAERGREVTLDVINLIRAAAFDGAYPEQVAKVILYKFDTDYFGVIEQMNEASFVLEEFLFDPLNPGVKYGMTSTSVTQELLRVNSIFVTMTPKQVGSDYSKSDNLHTFCTDINFHYTEKGPDFGKISRIFTQEMREYFMNVLDGFRQERIHRFLVENRNYRLPKDFRPKGKGLGLIDGVSNTINVTGVLRNFMGDRYSEEDIALVTDNLREFIFSPEGQQVVEDLDAFVISVSMESLGFPVALNVEDALGIVAFTLDKM